MNLLIKFFISIVSTLAVVAGFDSEYEVHLGVYPEREVATPGATVSPDIDCAGMHYEYLQHKNVDVVKFRSRWNFHADAAASCAQACNQVINFDCKTFLFKHHQPGSANGTCMLSEVGERELEPVKICFGSSCRNDLYNRIGCVPIACDASSCPDIPSTFCHEGEEIKHHNSTDKDACCPLFAECVCKPETCNTQIGEKPVGTGVVSATKTGSCCAKWDVVCDSKACLPEADLKKRVCPEPGQISVLANGPCCKEAKCVCESSSCPLPMQCNDQEQLVVTNGKCCNVISCQPRPTSQTVVPTKNGTDIYPLCGQNGEHGHIDPVWCEVLLRVEDSERHAGLLFGLMTAFLCLVIIAAGCAVIIMLTTLFKVGKNKLA